MTTLSYLLQRGTAMLMVPLIITHLAVIIMAVQGGLSADEILARTHGNMVWAGFYGVFVFAASIHAGIGVQTIVREWTPLGRLAAANIGHTLITILWVLGARAVYAVIWA
jgi:fumarate reductase subunit C